MVQHFSGFAVSASFVGPGICSWILPEAGTFLQLDPSCSWILPAAGSPCSWIPCAAGSHLQLEPSCSWIPLQLPSLSKELPWLQESPLQCTDDNVVIMLRLKIVWFHYLRNGLWFAESFPFVLSSGIGLSVLHELCFLQRERSVRESECSGVITARQRSFLELERAVIINISPAGFLIDMITTANLFCS